MKRVLITGKNGLLGWELRHALTPLGEVIALCREQLDLTDLFNIRSKVQEIKPDIIVNAAAYTAVDQAEDNYEQARVINALAPAVLAEEAKKRNALFVHYSTDYVFDGTKMSPYMESDPTNPLNVYGCTKLEGEKAIEAVGGAYFIFRTSWIYAMRGKNFVLTILRLARERDELRVVSDQMGIPNWSRIVAEATGQALAQAATRLDPLSIADMTGIYHLSGNGPTSWFQFAQEILKLANERREDPASMIPCHKARLLPISTEEYPLRAERPKYSVLSNTKLHDVFGILLPHWQGQLRRAFAEPA